MRMWRAARMERRHGTAGITTHGHSLKQEMAAAGETMVEGTMRGSVEVSVHSSPRSQ